MSFRFECNGRRQKSILSDGHDYFINESVWNYDKNYNQNLGTIVCSFYSLSRDTTKKMDLCADAKESGFAVVIVTMKQKKKT